MNFTHRLGNPALAAFIADQYEPDRKPQRTPERVRMSAADQQLRASMDKPPVLKPVCETCDDTGECMQMVCYGGPPVERMGECPDCKPKARMPVSVEDAGWIDWHGSDDGSSPVPDGYEFRPKLRSGYEYLSWYPKESHFRWNHNAPEAPLKHKNDIVAYQLRKKEK